MTQEACPSGFYCPVNSSYPVPCPAGHYCGESCETEPCPGAIMPIKCPLGYREKDGSRRSTFVNTCQICAAGTYGNDPDRANCTICVAGVVCLQGATTDNPQGNDTQNGVNVTNSYPCPVGKCLRRFSLRKTSCKLVGTTPNKICIPQIPASLILKFFFVIHIKQTSNITLNFSS